MFGLFTRLLVIVFVVLQLVVVFTTCQTCSQWSGVVFVNDSITIAPGACLSVADNTQVVFSGADKNGIVISVQGQVSFGKNVVVQSLSEYKGDVQGSSGVSTDEWSIQIMDESQQEALALESCQFRKSTNYKRVAPMFLIGKAIPIKISSSTFEGGNAAFYFRSNTTKKQEGEPVIKIEQSTFKSMIIVLDLSAMSWEEDAFKGNYISILVSDSLFQSIWYPISVFTASFNSLNLFISSSTMRNVEQGVASNNAISLKSVVFENFAGAAKGASMKVSSCLFNNTNWHKSRYSYAITDIGKDLVKTVAYTILDSTFLGIRGDVLAVSADCEELNFGSNLVADCGSHEETTGGIITTSTMGTLSLAFNEFQNNDAPNRHLIFFPKVGSVSITRNTFVSNSADTILHIEQSEKLTSGWEIKQNIFDNNSTGTSSKPLTKTEISFGTSLSHKQIPGLYNYWGTANSITEGMTSSQLSKIISNKIEPTSALNYIPFFLTNNVKNFNESNLGGLPANSTQNGLTTDEVIEIAVGSAGGVFLMAIFITTCVLLAIYVKQRKGKKRYESLNNI